MFSPYSVTIILGLGTAAASDGQSGMELTTNSNNSVKGREAHILSSNL
jgi:hypothetical protein